MRLIQSDIPLDICFRENQIENLIVENKEMYRQLLKDLWNQVQDGKEGSFILSVNDKEISLSKEAGIIINPFEVSCNDKKLLTKLYNDIKQITLETNQEKTVEMSSYNISYLDSILESVPYSLEYDLNIDLVSILKLYNVHICEEGEKLIDKLINYIKLNARICNIKLFIIVGLKQWFEKEDLLSFYKEVFNEHVFILDIEPYELEKIDFENIHVIDKDLCIVEF